MNDKHDIFDVIIVGAGPAGSASALYCARHNINVLLLEKEKFPRDKICGDAISGKSMSILHELDLLDKAKKLPGAEIVSIVFGSPDNNLVDIGLTGDKRKDIPGGLVIRRRIFDEFLFNEVLQTNIQTRQSFIVKNLLFDGDRVAGISGTDASGKTCDYSAKLVIGSDGYNSVVARNAGLQKHESGHWVVALRQYYHNIEGLNNKIELHYIDEVQPGYFWIFPVDNNTANVGIGMLHKSLKEKKINLKKSLQAAINSPAFKERFSAAAPLEEPVGWNLPVASKHRKNYGNGFLLTGDAAGLIDPFTGEGIGNAMYSAKHAARTAKEALEANNFSEGFLSSYDRQLWAEIGDELQVSTKLQRIGRMRFLLNFVLNKASRSREVRELISGMMANKIPKTRLANPLFYLRLLFN